jgi:hypothetical protein
VVGLVVLAACQPIRPPSPPVPQPVARYCAPQTPRSAAEYQAAFDNLRRTYTEWASADGAVPVRISPGTDQRTVWMFGDTYIGKVATNGLIVPSNRIVNNSFVVQDGPCFTPLMGGSPLARRDLIPDPQPGYWYWPASAVVDGAKLRVFVLRVVAVPTLLGFQVVDTQVATFSLPGLALEGVQALPIPTPSTRPYGSTAYADPANIYLYGAYSAGEDAQTHWVARVPRGNLFVASAWQFWTGTAWSADPNAAAPVTFIGTPDLSAPSAPDGFYDLIAPAAQLSVTRAPAGAGYGYLGIAKLLDALSPDISKFTSPTPYGPWTYAGTVANTIFTYRTAYAASVHPSLPGATGPIVGYSTNDNPFDSTELPPSTIEYGPRFVPPLVGSLP